MARALPSHGVTQTQLASGASYGLALQTHPAAGAFAATTDIVAAIEGYPTWSDPALRNVAATQGHAQALIAAYRQKGNKLLDVLRGSFTFAVIDIAAEKLLTAIDRVGIQTLCYAQPAPDLVVFGATTDAVRAHPAVKATIATQSVFDYFYFIDRVAAPSTIYREQRKLTPGEYLAVENGKTATASYWQMPYRAANTIGKATAADALKQQLRHAVETSLIGENGDHVGAFLSGGLDSSSVVGVAAGLLPNKLQSFTIGFPVEGFDEAYYADLAAKHFKTKHQTYYVQAQDVVDVLLKAVQIYDEPFGNSSFIPAYYCAKIAKEAGVEMMLAGDGGDELFAGNKRYAEDGVYDYYTRLPAALRRGLVSPLCRVLPESRRAGLLGKIVRYVRRAEKSVPERMADNIFQALSAETIFAPEALRDMDPNLPLTLAEEIFDAPRDASKVQRMMHLDLRITLADTDLRKVVRMCELAGVRTRFPFLDDDLVEFSASLPETLLMENGKLRQFYKDAMSDFLPGEIINKTKHGFGLPYLSFMNSYAPLRDLVCDSLTNLKRHAYFRAQFLDALIASARQGQLSGHQIVAWDLVVMDLWLESRR